MARPRAAAAPDDSRDRVFRAASVEFAARGYAGASVDRIARTARLNKAMIYYHFGSKARLYRAILRDMFDAAAAHVHRVARSDASPADKIRAFIVAIADEADARPHFPLIWLREVAEGGEHVDTATLKYASSVLASLAAIIEEGRRGGVFQPANPLLVHGGIVAPLMFFIATGKVRKKFERAGVRGATAIARDTVISHIQRLTLAALEGRLT